MRLRKLEGVARLIKLSHERLEALIAEGEGVARAYECQRCGASLASTGPGRNRKHCAKCRVAHLRDYQRDYKRRTRAAEEEVPSGT